MEFHSKGNVTPDGMSLKMECNPNWIMSLSMECHLKWGQSCRIGTMHFSEGELEVLALEVFL